MSCRISVRPGDVLFYEPATYSLWGKVLHFASWRIQVHGHSRFSHVALYAGWGDIVQATTSGVSWGDALEDFASYDGTIYAGRPAWPDADSPRRAIEWACSRVGTRYGFQDLLGCLIWDLTGWYPLPATHAMICSELVGLALAEGGVVIPPENGVVWTPRDIEGGMDILGKLRRDPC